MKHLNGKPKCRRDMLKMTKVLQENLQGCKITSSQKRSSSDMCMTSLCPQTQKQQGKTSEKIFKKQSLHANNLYAEEEPVPSLLFAGRSHRMSVRNFSIQILSNVWSRHQEQPCPYFLKPSLDSYPYRLYFH